MKNAVGQHEGCGMGCKRNAQPTNAKQAPEMVTDETGHSAPTTRTVEGHAARANETIPLESEPREGANGEG